jgi:hypothetical protein
MSIGKFAGRVRGVGPLAPTSGNKWWGQYVASDAE